MFPVIVFVKIIFLSLPLKKEGILFCICWLAPFDSFAWKLPNLVQWMPLGSRWPYWCWGHIVKGQSQTVGLNPKCCLLNILLVKLWIKVKLSKWSISKNHQTKQIRLSLASNLLNHQLETSLHICNPSEFCTRGIYVSQTFLVFFIHFYIPFKTQWTSFERKLGTKSH